FFYPGVLLMLLGLIVGIAILPGPIDVLGARLDVHTLLYAGAAVVVGFQACLFAVMARVFAQSEGFLPDNELVRRARRAFSLEVGLLIGAALVLASVTLSVIAVVRWVGSTFKPLNYTDTMRIVIP